MEDVFCRSLDSSDLMVSNYSIATRRKKLHKTNLPTATLSLLEQPDPPAPLTPRRLGIDSQTHEEKHGETEDFSILANNFIETLDAMSLEEEILPVEVM